MNLDSSSLDGPCLLVAPIVFVISLLAVESRSLLAD